MKLHYVEVAGFRGVRETMRIECAPGFVVITGRNGVGKSTVFDAIDYALTGAINKFNVTGAKGGGIDEHLWQVGEPAASSHYVSVGFVDDRGDRFSMRRARERDTEGDPDEILRRLCRPNWGDRTSISTLMQTTLIRDEFIAALTLDLPEQARFTAVRAAMGAITGPDYSRRTEAVQKAAIAVRDNQKGLLEQAQAELGRTLTSLTEARSTADLSADISEAMRLTDAAIGPGVSGPAERDRMLRKTIADRGRKLAAVGAAVSSARSSATAASAALELANAELSALEGERQSAQRQLQEVAETYSQLKFDAPADDPARAWGDSRRSQVSRQRVQRLGAFAVNNLSSAASVPAADAGTRNAEAASGGTWTLLGGGT